jgi:iron complex transport system substrate-binding protein
MGQCRHFSKLGLIAVLALCLLVPAMTRGADSVTGSTPGPSVPGYDSSRIISIGGSITEILYALGLQQQIIAVDTTSLYPPNVLKDKPNVGYMRQLSAEGVLGLSPTLILAIEGSGPHETIDVLERAKVPFVIIPDRFSADGVFDKIRIISADVGVPGRGECLANTVRQDMATLDAQRGRITQQVKVAFILSLANGRPVIAGRQTAADGIIRLAGGANAFDDFEGYKPVNDEAISAARPDAVLVMDRGEHALSADMVFSEPGLALTPAAEHRVLISMDGLYLLGFGPRTVRAARDLASRLYPKMVGEGLPSERSSSSVACDK